MDRQRILAASREEVARLAGQPISEVTPSRRDFTQYVATQKQDLAVIARLGAAPTRHWSAAELVRHARACDDAEVAAIAVTTGSDGLSLDLLAAIADATTAPILRDDLLIDPTQLYASRLRGADAAILPAAELSRTILQEMVSVASSMHMAAVIEVLTAAEIEAALHFPHAIIGLRCLRADHTLDVQRTRQLAEQLPPGRTVIALPEIRSRDDWAALRGRCDAVMVGEALVGLGDVGAALGDLVAR